MQEKSAARSRTRVRSPVFALLIAGLALSIPNLPAAAALDDAADQSACSAKEPVPGTTTDGMDERIEATFRRGRALHHGEGVEPDRRLALELLRQASDAGHAEASEELGLMLSQEAGDHREALLRLDRAARLGRPLSLFLMGLAYADGEELPRNRAIALAYLTRASTAGFTDAQGAIERLKPLLSPSDLDQASRYDRMLANDVSAFSKGVPPQPAATSTDCLNVRGVPSATSGGWAVQLGAYGTKRSASEAWERLSRGNPPLSLRPAFEPAGTLTRLRVYALNDRATAQTLCRLAATVALPCIILRDQTIPKAVGPSIPGH